ncbi:MAG: hypothetical protein HYZ83_00165 [Candidatus Omnitrophica bacterium]|nr:hypothetical protein [Candidatus Omnitrophota bacterium]
MTMPDSPHHPELEHAIRLEREAGDLLFQKKIDEAFQAYDKAARLYQKLNEHLKSAFCFASAATCWNIHTGWQPMRNAATRNDLAAREAVKAKHYAYARWLFREASLLYEQEGDYEKYSSCFTAAQDTYVRYNWDIFIRGREQGQMDLTGRKVNLKDRIMALVQGIFGIISKILWGYGELPFNTFIVGSVVILTSAYLYHISGMIHAGGVQRPVDFFEALYFSVVTFSTVGYGDYVPLGWVRFIAVLEAFSGIFLMPLFVICLSRRYLRVYR